MKQSKIKEILDLLEALYKNEGCNQRFFQFIYFVQNDYEELDPRARKIVRNYSTGFDFFYVEDEDFLDYLKERLEFGRRGSY